MVKIEKIDEKNKTVTVTLSLNEVKMLYLWERACEMYYDKTGCCYNLTLCFFGFGKEAICRSLDKFIDEVLTKLDKNYKDLKIEKKKKEKELKKEERMYIS